MLRVLQDKFVKPLGGEKLVHVDVRIIAATKADLEKAVGCGRFRDDLFFRLNVIRIHLPPLSDRGEDILLLARFFLRKFTDKHKKPIEDFAPAAIDQFRSYSWPGNVRELENCIERAVILSTTTRINNVDIPIASRAAALAPLKIAKAEFEKRYIIDVLRAHDWNVTRAAKGAGKSRRAFSELIRKYNVIRPRRSAGAHAVLKSA